MLCDYVDLILCFVSVSLAARKDGLLILDLGSCSLFLPSQGVYSCPNYTISTCKHNEAEFICIVLQFLFHLSLSPEGKPGQCTPSRSPLRTTL